MSDPVSRLNAARAGVGVKNPGQRSVTLGLLIRGGDKGAQAAVAGVSALQPSRNSFDETELADEHSLGPVRLYNVMCWIYGSDPVKYSQLVDGGSLPEERAVPCAGEWDRMAKAWQRLLAPYRA